MSQPIGTERADVPLLLIDAESGGVPGRSLLSRLSLIVMVAMLSATVVAVLSGRMVGMVALGSGAAFAVVAYALARRGAVAQAANLLVVGVWICISLNIAFNNGLRDLALLAYPGILILSATLLSRRSYRIILTATLVFVVGVGVAELQGWLVTPYSHTAQWTLVLSLLVVLTGSAALGVALVRRLLYSTQLARDAMASVESANARLQQQADELRVTSERQMHFVNRQFAVSRGLLHNPAIVAGDVRAAMRAVCEAASEVLLVRRASVWFFEGEGEGLQLRCDNLFIQDESHSHGQVLRRRDYPSYFAALKLDRVIAASDAHRDPRTREFSERYLGPLGIGAMLDVPLTLHGEQVGVLCLEHVGSARSWTAAEQAFAASLADHLQIAQETRERLSAQALAEQAHQQSEAMFYSTFSESPLLMAVTEAQAPGRLLEVNEAFVRTLGYPRDEVVGRTGAEVGYWSEATSKAVGDLLRAQGSVSALEVPMRAADGRELITLVYARSRKVRDDWRLFWYSTDITEVRQAQRALEELNRSLERKVAERTEALEQALQRLREAQQEIVQIEKIKALDTIVAGVAHELNTPIGNALTVATTLEEKTRSFVREAEGGALRRASLQDYLGVAAEASRLISRNLHNAGELVRSFKQVAVDQASAQRRRFDLAVTMEELLTTLHHRFKGEPVALHTEFEPGLIVDSFPGPLGQVVTNLVTNSLAHAFEGRVQGHVTVRARSAGADHVLIECEDDGNGVPQAHMPRLFDPFFTTKMGRGGSGLGLPIAHNIVTGLLGGRIQVSSQPGEGTRFTITLPRVAPVTVPNEAPAAP